jgi:hypothetical protein
MRGIIRLIDGLLRGDQVALYVLIFAVVATIIIVSITEVIQRKRRR